MTVETTNGHLKGRAGAALPQFTFPDSGITVGLRRFSPDTQDRIVRELQRKSPPPPAPEIETELGSEPNPADPDYQQALATYWARINLEASERMFQLALRQIDVEVDHAALDRLKADMEAIDTPLDADKDDRDLYIRHICISSVHDLTALLSYLQRYSTPTEEAIQERLDSFRGNVPGS